MARMHRPHALAFPFPAQGHINPMIHLCRRLASMGFTITFLSTKSMHDPMFKHKSLAESEDFRFMSVSDACLAHEKLKDNLQKFLNAMEGMRPDVEKVLQQLMEDSSRPPVTCILADAFIGWTQDVAHKFGICRVSFWTSCATWGLVCLHLHLLQDKGLLPARGSTQVLDFIPGMPPIAAKHLPGTLQEEDADDPGFIHRFHRNSILRDDAWVLVNSLHELEPDQLDQLQKENPNFVPVGPIISYPLDEGCGLGQWKEDISCLEWLDKQPPLSVLYISFGSLATFTFDQIKEISKGLERSEQAFLWVIRLDFVESEEQRNEILGKILRNKRGMVVSWAPQLKVLQHGSVAAFLTHCGWNSLTEAVALGVPTLAWPCFAEQHLNALLAVEHWKVGLYACNDNNEDKKIVSASHVEKVVREVMVGEQASALRRRVRELSDAAMRSVSEGGFSHRNLQAFSEDMRERAAAKQLISSQVT